MNLISILLGLAIEYFAGPLDRFRNWLWFENYTAWLESRCRKSPMWDGPVGVILTLALPVLVLLLVSTLLGKISILLPYLLAVIVFVYCLGPNTDTLLNNYVQALEGNIDEDIALIEQRLGLKHEDKDTDGDHIIAVALTRSHDAVFAVMFWFIVLGMYGALLYGLTLVLKRRLDGTRSGYAIAVDELHNILIWPSTRLLAIGFALSGSLVDTLEAWRKVQGDTFNCSQQVLVMSGLGALQYADDGDLQEDEPLKVRYIQWIREAQALINRTLIVWLAALGLLTLGNILS